MTNYTISISSGMGSIAKVKELMGLGAKTAAVTTSGVSSIQVQVESPAEFIDPQWKQQLKSLMDSLGITWSMHGEISQMVSWDSANEQLWRFSHDRLHSYLDSFYDVFVRDKNFGKYKPTHINFHGSHSEPLGILPSAFRTRQSVNVDFNGRADFTEIMEKENTNQLKEWFKYNLLDLILPFDSFMIMFGQILQARRDLTKKLADSIPEDIFKEDVKTLDLATKEGKRKYTEEEINESWIEFKKGNWIIQDYAEFFKYLWEHEKKYAHEMMLQVWIERSKEQFGRGAIENEEAVYVLVAKYMEIKKNDPNEPIWNIFFKGRSLEDLQKDWGIGKGSPRPMVDREKGKIDLTSAPDLIAAVACRYIMGHFQADPFEQSVRERKKMWEEKNGKKDNSEFYRKKAFDKMDIVQIPFTFENPELSQIELPGRERIIRLNHLFNLVQAMRRPIKNKHLFSILIDLEHYVHNAIDIEKEILNAPKDIGKYVTAIHIYSLVPIHMHWPIDIGSEEQRITYKYLWLLRERGMMKADLIFERGQGQQPGEYLKTSVQAVRMIANHLDKNFHPDKLPVEFYGASSEGFYSPQRQEAMIKEHFFDPLKGMLQVPEEEFTFLSSAAIAKGKKPEEFKKEELK